MFQRVGTIENSIKSIGYKHIYIYCYNVLIIIIIKLGFFIYINVLHCALFYLVFLVFSQAFREKHRNIRNIGTIPREALFYMDCNCSIHIVIRGTLPKKPEQYPIFRITTYFFVSHRPTNPHYIVLHHPTLHTLTLSYKSHYIVIHRV